MGIRTVYRQPARRHRSLPIPEKGPHFALLLQGAGFFVDARRGYNVGMSDSAESVAQAFVRAINRQDVEALAAFAILYFFMPETHSTRLENA